MVSGPGAGAGLSRVKDGSGGGRGGSEGGLLAGGRKALGWTGSPKKRVFWVFLSDFELGKEGRLSQFVPEEQLVSVFLRVGAPAAGLQTLSFGSAHLQGDG